MFCTAVKIEILALLDVVGKATRLEVDGPGSKSGGGEIFRTCPDRP
jgi:hypothetical protein